jgi:phosphate transport system permease protein
MSKLYARRRVRNTVLMTLSVAATVVGLGWLVLVLGALLWNGFAGLSVQVFTEMTPPPGSAGGLLNPIVGSMMMTALAVAFGTPIGILAGTYMAEYGQYAKLTTVVRFINDILLSAPSILVGLFIYEVMVRPMGHFSGLSGAVALAVIVVPVVVRTTEDMLILVRGSCARRRPPWACRARMSSRMSPIGRRARASSPESCSRWRASAGKPRHCCSRP